MSNQSAQPQTEQQLKELSAILTNAGKHCLKYVEGSRFDRESTQRLIASGDRIKYGMMDCCYELINPFHAAESFQIPAASAFRLKDYFDPEERKQNQAFYISDAFQRHFLYNAYKPVGSIPVDIPAFKAESRQLRTGRLHGSDELFRLLGGDAARISLPQFWAILAYQRDHGTRCPLLSKKQDNTLFMRFPSENPEHNLTQIASCIWDIDNSGWILDSRLFQHSDGLETGSRVVTLAC